MMDQDLELEQRLRRLRPTEAMPLQPPPRIAPIRTALLTAAAFIMAVGLVITLQRGGIQPTSEAPAIPATNVPTLQLLHMEPAELDRVLLQQAGGVLPNPATPHTALQRLARPDHNEVLP